MNLLISTKDYSFYFTKIDTGFFDVFFTVEWNKFIEVGTCFYVDRKTLKKMLAYCVDDVYSYFNNFNTNDYIVEALEAILLVFRKNEKAKFSFS